ncbi:MFS transporter [Streptomyces griseoaurantiacus]|nr:putative transport protein HsrA [Streptomyces sp. MH192]MCF0102499.1 putative transport protein HsrA [Streptomyces sp. MH191]GHE74089.1 MFS transporter [Streptomyces griseoaurantiacus]
MALASSVSEAVGPPGRLGKAPIAALGILALALGALQSVLDPALPLLQRELGLSPSEGALVGNTLLVTGAVVAPVAGKLGDRYGGRRVLLRLMAVVSAGGVLASLAPNLPVLLLGQVMQGVMVGALPLSFILVRKNLPAARSQAAIGLVLALFTGGGMVGTLFAGPVAEGLSWHWMFALPTAVIIVATLAVLRLMPHDPPARADSRIDWPGVLLLSGALLTFMIGLVRVTGSGLPPLAVAGLVVLVAALVTAWILVERRTASPMVDLRMLARPSMWHACLLTLVVSSGFGMTALLIPQLLAMPEQAHGFGADTTDIGLLLLPGAIAGSLADSVGGLATRRFGPRVVVVAGSLVAAATLFALASLHSSSWQLVLAKALTAFAAGVGTTALLAGAATDVGAEDTGIATSLLVVTRVIGVAVGAQIGASILDSGADAVTGLPAESAFVTGFTVAGLVAAVALLAVRLTKNRTTTSHKGARA